MVTIHLLTLNNSLTIQKALQSIGPCEFPVLIGDLGSHDNTVEICRSMGYQPLLLEGYKRLVAREYMASRSGTEWNMFLEPWEAITQGHRALEKPTYSYSKIIQGTNLTQEIRFWRKGDSFTNRVFERIDKTSKVSNELVLFSAGRSDYDSLLKEIQEWKSDEPMAHAPYYYNALILFIQNRYEEFGKIAEFYFHLTRGERNIARTMLLYYYAMSFLIHHRKVRPALQSLNLCLCENPLMAEFWCLTADIHYHLRGSMRIAKGLYENAIILGGHRSLEDRWPMDLSKYKDYPERMMDSCQRLIGESKRLTSIPPQVH